MKVEIKRKDFLNVLATGSLFSGRSKSMAVLDNVKIRIKGSSIDVSSFDLENAIMKRGEVISSEQDITFLVHAKDLLDILRSLKDENIVFKIVENKEIVVKHKRGSISLPILSANDFPTPQKESEAIEVTLKSETLFNWLKNASNFIATDDLRPTMKGIYLEVKEGYIWCAATDAHKLFADCEEYHDKELQVDTIINNNAINPIVGILNETDNVTLCIGKTNTIFKVNGAMVSTRRIEGRYPNFKNIIPNEFSKVVTLNKSELVDSVGRLVITAGIISLLKLNLNGTILNIDSEDLDFAKKSHEEIWCEQASGEITIGVKGTLLQNVLRSFDVEKITLQMNDETRPLLFVCDERPNMRVLLMPMLFNG